MWWGKISKKFSQVILFIMHNSIPPVVYLKSFKFQVQKTIMKWKMVSNKNSNAIDNFYDKTFIQSSEEKEPYLEYSIEKILQKLDLKHKESCKVFSINEVADMLKVSKRTIEGHLYDKRDLPYLKIGRKVRITKSDLESFLGLVS